MRITTGMLNQTAREAGLPVNNVSLLNYVNNTSNNLSLVNALNQKDDSYLSRLQKEEYEELGNDAKSLMETINQFWQTEENDIFAQAREEGSTKEIQKNISSMVDKYNTVLESLEGNSNSLNRYYRQMLTDLPAKNKEALEVIGITQAKDGSLSIDKEKLAAADVDTLEAVFGNNNDFTTKLSFLADRISDNAYANAESSSMQYDSTGNTYSSLVNQMKQYDFWG